MATPSSKLAADVEAVDAFLAASPAPTDLEADGAALLHFVKQNLGDGKRKIALVTSGGTTVNLERRAVRFIDNFSTGRRGAATVEHLLEQGYAVINLARHGSAAPFARTLQDATSAHVDLALMAHLEERADGSLALNLPDASAAAVKLALKECQEFTAGHRLLRVRFATLSDYLHKLKACAEALRPAGAGALFVLAAAVSDFHIPPEEMADHKIQSRAGALELGLAQVPKALGVLRHVWAPQGFYVSFKLETDHDILISKARAAMALYDMHLVVANELLTRYQQVSLVSEGGEAVIRKASEDEEVEVPMVKALSTAHDAFTSAPAAAV